jgi:hypothetical protein
MANHSEGDGDSLRFSLVTGIEAYTGPLDEPQMGREVFFESLHAQPFLSEIDRPVAELVITPCATCQQDKLPVKVSSAARQRIRSSHYTRGRLKRFPEFKPR